MTVTQSGKEVVLKEDTQGGEHAKGEAGENSGGLRWELDDGGSSLPPSAG